MATFARHLVSRGKRRFIDKDTHTDLDLAYITDRLLIMGWPAQGLSSLYRNSMQDVLRFLEARHGDNWRIFNFVPRCENSYDAEAVYGRVMRFPFPDHHAPPLPIIQLFVDAVSAYLDTNEANVAVIHCKAGKGRSGTLTCCYLLSLPELPKPPQTAGSRPPDTTLRAESDDDESHSPAKGATHALADVKGKQRAERLSDALSTLQDDDRVKRTDEAGEEPTSSAAAAESADIGEKLQFVFQLHTKQRMAAAKEGSYGISIPSQRRFVGYYARMLADDDPRVWMQRDNLHSESTQPRTIRIQKVVVHMADRLKGLPPPLSGKRVSVVVSRYNDAYMADMETRERRARLVKMKGGGRGQIEAWNDGDWRDTGDLFTFCGRLVQDRHGDGESDSQIGGKRVLLPKVEDDITADGIKVGADRQILLKLLIGQTGSKHDLLPDVASLGYAWFIPSFETPIEPGQPLVWTIGRGELDFCKAQAGFEGMEVHCV